MDIKCKTHNGNIVYKVGNIYYETTKHSADKKYNYYKCVIDNVCTQIVEPEDKTNIVYLATTNKQNAILVNDTEKYYIYYDTLNELVERIKTYLMTTI